MKHADLRLDTVYVNHDGAPLMVVSLDKVKTSRGGYSGPTSIIEVTEKGKPFGVVTITPAHYNRDSIDGLTTEAQKYRAARPTEVSYGAYQVSVTPLRLIVGTWEDHLVQKAEEARFREAKLNEQQRAREVREALQVEIRDLLPEGIDVRGYYADSDYVQISLPSLLKLLKATSTTE